MKLDRAAPGARARRISALGALSGVALALATSSGACGGEDAATKPATQDVGGAIDAGASVDAEKPCGDPGDLPVAATRDDAARTLTVTCAADPGVLAITALKDGVVRMRYGEDARGSIARVVNAEISPAPLRLGRRGEAVVLCTPELEITVTPGACSLRATDAASGEVVLDDGEGGGFFRDERTASGQSAASGA